MGNYQFLVEYLVNGQDFNDEINTKNEYVILRNYDIYNDVVYDKDIFFIDSDIYKEYYLNNHKFGCYPCYSKDNKLFFSRNVEEFNNYHLYNIQDLKYDIHTDNTKTDNKLVCDKLRIYIPSIKKNWDFVVYIDNYINDIHFHYICSNKIIYEKKYHEEIKYNMNSYIEYIEILLPNIKYLFNKDNKFYIEDNINNISITDTSNIIDYYKNKDNIEETNKLYFHSLVQPFFIDDDKDGINKKVYIDNNIDHDLLVNTSINIMLYPFDEIVDDHYILDDKYTVSNLFIQNNFYLNLVSKLGFVNDKFSLINTFDYPNKEKEFEEYDDHIYTKEEYNDIINQYLPNEGDEEDDENNNETILIDPLVKYYNLYYANNIMDNYEHEYFGDEEFESIRTTGFVIQIATDRLFKEIIFESTINTDHKNDPFIYDFNFELNNIFESRDQLNDILICRSLFIDKKFNNVIISNNVILNKEKFKYLINDINTSTVYYKNQNNLINENFMDIKTGFNLIDKFNCIIKEEDTHINTINNLDNNTKIIYKPIFYKVQELQNLKIRKGVVQNIGINLGEYMSKVNLFILNINNISIRENSRNDYYVIFNIDANLLENTSGTYNILNSEFDYISSGNYSLY